MLPDEGEAATEYRVPSLTRWPDGAAEPDSGALSLSILLRTTRRLDGTVFRSKIHLPAESAQDARN